MTPYQVNHLEKVELLIRAVPSSMILLVNEGDFEKGHPKPQNFTMNMYELFITKKVRN